ncbi:MAG: hypothetical protein Kapaf2KO_22540 [Candidatus Kapaibacteriales bacterium]
MSYKIGNIPSARSSKTELADFCEILAIHKSSLPISSTSLTKSLIKGSDEHDFGGIEYE